MTSVWDKWGKLIPLTVIHIDRNQVIDWKTEKKDGYNAMQIGCSSKNLNFIKNPKSDIT